MQKTVLHNQSLLDFAIQRTGTLESLFQLAIENGISITDELETGRFLLIPDNVKKDVDVLAYYNEKGIQPATALTAEETELVPRRGIGSMIISSTFIIG